MAAPTLAEAKGLVGKTVSKKFMMTNGRSKLFWGNITHAREAGDAIVFSVLFDDGEVHDLTPEESGRFLDSLLGKRKRSEEGGSTINASGKWVCLLATAEIAAQKQARREEAFAYIEEVKDTFKENEEVFHSFVATLAKRSEGYTAAQVAQVAHVLFQGHPKLLLGLHKFLPSSVRTLSLGHMLAQEMREFREVVAADGKMEAAARGFHGRALLNLTNAK